MFAPPIYRILKLLNIGFLSIIRSTYINLKVLPFKQAVKFPIIIKGRAKFCKLSKGCIEFTDGVRPGMLTFGVNLDHSYSGSTFLRIEGKLIITGLGFHWFGPDFRLNILPSGTLKIGNNFSMENEGRILVSACSQIGDDNMYSWGIALIDSDVHPIYNETNKRINPPKGFKIGNNVWIASDVTILKGVEVADGCIVGAKSLISKSLSSSNSIYAGNKLLRQNIKWSREIDNFHNLN